MGKYNDGVIQDIAANQKYAYALLENGQVHYVCFESDINKNWFSVTTGLDEHVKKIVAGDDFCLGSTQKGMVVLLLPPTKEADGDKVVVDDKVMPFVVWDMNKIAHGKVDLISGMDGSDTYAAILCTMAASAEDDNEEASGVEVDTKMPAAKNME